MTEPRVREVGLSVVYIEMWRENDSDALSTKTDPQ